MIPAPRSRSEQNEAAGHEIVKRQCRAVDPQTLLYTGLTRDGTFYIEDGKIKYPVKNFRDSAFQFYAGIYETPKQSG